MKTKKIRIKWIKVTPQTVLHFGPNKEPLGYMNELESNELRLQIINAQADGYYALFRRKKLYIDKNGGHYSSYPKGFYDQYINSAMKIIRARIAKRKEEKK